MGFGERLRRRRIMPQMQVGRVAPAIGGGDLGDDAVGIAHLQGSGGDADDRALRGRCDRIATSDVDVMGMTIDPVDSR